MARLTLVLLLAACAPGRPGWLTRGSGTEDRTLRGVGVVGGIHDPTVRARTADARARTEIVRQLDGFVAQVARDCGAWPALAKRRGLEQAMVWLENAAAGGIEIRDRWTDGEDSAALATLDLDRILEAWQAPPRVRDCALQGWQNMALMPR